jgi:hypothetical protein
MLLIILISSRAKVSVVVESHEVLGRGLVQRLLLKPAAKTLRPEKQSYRGPEQPPKAAGATNSRHNKLIKGQTEL